MLLEPDRHLLTDMHAVRRTTDDVRGQPDTGILGQGHVGDHIGRVEVEPRLPGLGIDREAHDRAPARHRRRLPRPTPAVGADRYRWVHECAAVGAALDAQATVST